MPAIVINLSSGSMLARLFFLCVCVVEGLSPLLVLSLFNIALPALVANQLLGVPVSLHCDTYTRMNKVIIFCKKKN